MKSDAVTFPFYFTHTRSSSLQPIHSSILVVMGTEQFEKVHLTNKKLRQVLRSVFFFKFKVREFRYLYWVPLYCEQIPLQQKRSTMKKKDKKHNRCIAYHAPISPVKCVWSWRFRSSSRTMLSSYAVASLRSRLALEVFIVQDKSSSVVVQNIAVFVGT